MAAPSAAAESFETMRGHVCSRTTCRLVWLERGAGRCLRCFGELRAFEGWIVRRNFVAAGLCPPLRGAPVACDVVLRGVA